MIEILGEGTKIHKILPPDTTDFNDDAYSAAVLKEIGEDRDIDSIRQDYINRSTSDIEEATASNLLKGAPADKVIPIHMKSIALIEQYYKDKKAYEIANEAASEKSFEQHLMDNPQALLNYANSGEIDVDFLKDSRILNLQYEISKTVDEDDFVFDLVTRTGVDFATGFAGRGLKKIPNPIAKGVGYALDTYGFGNAKDYVLLNGKTISETGMVLRQKYLEILDKDSSDEEFKKDVEEFIQELKKIPSPYRPEQIDHILSDVSPYADAGGAGLAYGIKTGASPFRTLSRLKGVAKLFGNSKKNTVNDGLMKEMDDLTTEQVSTTNTADTVSIDNTADPVKTTATVDKAGTYSFADYASAEERITKIARDIDERKSKGAVVLYNNHPVQVVTPLPTVKVFEPEILPNTDVVPYTPRALEGPTIIEAEVVPSGLLEAPVKTVPSPEPIKQLEYRPVFDHEQYGLDKEADWENRRITYTDDNRGRGYTLEEATNAIREYEQDFADAYRRGRKAVLVKKKTRSGFEYYDYEWVGNKNNYQYTVVSAASPTPFTRAASTKSTADKGAGGAFYGKGPYASVDNFDNNEPASFGHYRVGLEKSKFHDAVQEINQIDRFISDDYVVLEELIKSFKLDEYKVFEDAFETLTEAYEKAYQNNPTGMADYYTAFKKLKKDLHWWNTTNLSPVVRDNHDRVTTLLAERFVDDLLEKYKGFKSGVMNYWYGAVPESQRSHWVDQRNHRHIYDDQHPEVRARLDKYSKKVIKLKDKILDNSPEAKLKNKIFKNFLFEFEGHLFEEEMGLYSDVKDIQHFSDQYELFTRLAMDDMPIDAWEDFYNKYASMDISDHSYESLKAYESIQAMKRILSHNGQELQRKMLVQEGLWGDVHSDVNVVFFKQTPSQMSNVFKQTWVQDGYYYTKLLDNGAFPLYDPKLQAFVIKVSEVIPGKGRKPVLLNKQKIKKMKLKE